MSTILHSVQTKMVFLKRNIYCYFGRKVKHPSKGMVYPLKEQFIFLWILYLQKHTALPHRKVTLIKKGMLHFCFEYCICWPVWVLIMVKASSKFCRKCVLLKGHCSIFLR